MNTLRKYSNYIRFMFMRVNTQIINVRISRLSCFVHLPANDMTKIFNELGISTDKDCVSLSPEDAEALVGLLTTLGIRFTQSTGNQCNGATSKV